MKENGNIIIENETVPERGQRKGLTSHPYRVLELVRRKRTQSRERNGMPNRTIIKFKRRQGTQAGRKETVARHLKQISLDTLLTRKRRQRNPSGIQHERPHAIGKSGFGLPGSMSMARWERDDRNLGKTRDLPEEMGNQIRRVGGSTNRSEPIRSRVADRLVVDRASRLQPAGRSELIKRRGRQSNVARKGNMDL